MPSGPPELHAKWETDGNALTYLEKNGYILTRRFNLLTPKPDHKISEEEKSALMYLILEWDYGGAIRTMEDDN